MDSSCEFVLFISILACTIAKDKTQKEIEILAAFFTQLGDTLASISILNNPEKWNDFTYT